MFTGIIEEVGEVVGVEAVDGGTRLSIRGDQVLDGTRDGDSISVDGVCLTVTEMRADVFGADVMPETLRRSTLRGAAAGRRVNLERAATPTSRLGGHLVQGHVDGVGRIADRRPENRWDTVTIALDPELARYVAEKGSIAVDGVSLTVTAADDSTFSVGLIPATLAATTLGARAVGDEVNLEVDIVAKYVERLLATRNAAEPAT